MQKLKKVFSPGNDKDDEMMYGTPRKSADTGNSHSSATGQSDTASPTTQSQTSPSQEKYQGSSSQVRNTDSDKYDGQQYDKPMTDSEPPTVKPSEKQEDVLASRMGTSKEDNSVKRQVLDPSDSKRDETGYGATDFTNKHAEDTTTTPRQPNELGNVPPSHDSYTSTTTAATAAPGSAFTTNTRTMPPETDSRMSMKSGVVGSSDQRTTDRALGSDGITGERTPGSQADSSSNFSRNAALAGAGAAAGAGGAYAATRQRRQSRTSGDQDVEDATYTDRSFPLRGGTTSHVQEDRPTSSVYSNDAAGPSSTSAYIDPSTSGSQQTGARGLGYGSGSAAVAGAGAGAVGAAATKEKLADHTKHSHEYHGDPCLEGEHSPADKTLPYVPGPHQTVAANLEDPHVPGEFPKEDGTDPHGSRGLGGFGAASSHQQPTLLSNKQPDVKTGSSYPMQSSPSEKQSGDHHYGTLAAGAGAGAGAGAAGLGTYAATRDRGTTSGDAPSRDVASPQTSSAVPTQTPKQALDDSTTGASEPKKEHHYGRDAAVAGGTGAAGAAAYTAYQRSKDRDDTVPSSRETAPHSNVTGPMSSSKDTAPRESTIGAPSGTQTRDVTQSTAPKDEKEHHYGRDAALAGGAGAAGYGAYQYSKDRGNDDLGSKTADPYDTYRDAADPSTRPDTSSHGATTGTHTSTSSKADPYTAPQQQQQQQQQQYQQTSPPQEEHHHTRNAALAGGAGAAAGAAGYSTLQSERGNTGPASKTIGPHESNVANILDPRVRPEPEKMKDHTTSGPWQSDTLNKLDPKVESNPEKADVKAHGYASGVAPQQMQQQQRATANEQDPEHKNRNAGLAAAGGAAGAGAAAYGAKEAYDSREQGQEMSAKEQEKLAKEHEKEAAKQAKQDQKEAEKQAKHDQKEAEKQQKHEQKEAEKQAKHDAKEREKAQKHADAEAEKARKKEEEKALAERQKAEKKHAHELEKEEKQRSKDAEKAEKERLHEQEELDREKSKEDERLAEARDEEAEKRHHEHNKLHKTPPEEREKKGGILHRIFHHKAHEREGVEPGERQSGSFEGERERGLVGEGVERGEGEGYSHNLGDRDSGVVTEKSTGLPMNVGKYGSGAGGTDGGEHIHGYQGEAR